MDPQACFARYVAAIADGCFDDIYEAAQDYHDWIRKGGFKATDADGSPVLKMEPEKDCYLALCDGVEVWRYPPT